MAAHNKKYHASGPYQAHIWEITMGKHQGEYLYAMGPCTYTDLDSRPFGDDHDQDWNKIYMAYIDKECGSQFWKHNKEVSYNPEGAPAGKVIWTSYDIKPFEGYRFSGMLKKVVEVYKTKKYPHSFNVYDSQFDFDNGEDVVLEWQFEKWAFLDREETFKKDFEEVHGEGSWQQFMEEYRDVVEKSVDEVAIYRADLSGGQ
jgi:hypothetical protein